MGHGHISSALVTTCKYLYNSLYTCICTCTRIQAAIWKTDHHNAQIPATKSLKLMHTSSVYIKMEIHPITHIFLNHLVQLIN